MCICVCRKFGARNELRFVNVVCEQGVEIGLRDALFTHPPRSLELLGFNFDFHAVGRAAGTGEPVFAERWPWPKVFYASMEHEEEEDWEWLLRHHGHNDKIDIGACFRLPLTSGGDRFCSAAGRRGRGGADVSVCSGVDAEG